jgi:WD40 repeat protein
MSLSRESIAGILSIVSLVATAVWYARDPQQPNWAVPVFQAGGESRPPLPEICVGQLDWSKDGRIVLTRTRSIGKHEELLTLHSLAPGAWPTPIGTAQCGGAAAVLAPDGLHVLVGTWSGELWWIDAESSETVTLAKLPEPQGFTCVALVEKEGRLVAAGGASSGTILLCDPSRRTVSELASSRKSSNCCVHSSRNGDLLVSGCADGSITVWNLESGEQMQNPAGHARTVKAAAFLQHDTQIISAGLDDSVRIWDIASGREEWRGEFGLGGVCALEVAPDGRTAAWGGFGPRIVVWDLEHRRKKFECATAARFVSAMKLSPDGMTLAVAGFEGTVRMYDMRSGAELKGLAVAEQIDSSRTHSGD